MSRVYSKCGLSLVMGLALVLPVAAAGDGSQIFQAIRNGDIPFIKAHLTKAEIEIRDRRGATPLMHAAAFGNLETLKLLLDAGADVNVSNDSKATALLWAARNPDKARLLIERGANPNAQSKQGRRRECGGHDDVHTYNNVRENIRRDVCVYKSPYADTCSGQMGELTRNQHSGVAAD